MCGISGMLMRDGAAVPAARLAAMGRALAHRGPDGHAEYRNGDVGFRHEREDRGRRTEQRGAELVGTCLHLVAQALVVGQIADQAVDGVHVGSGRGTDSAGELGIGHDAAA